MKKYAGLIGGLIAAAITFFAGEFMMKKNQDLAAAMMLIMLVLSATVSLMVAMKFGKEQKKGIGSARFRNDEMFRMTRHRINEFDEWQKETQRELRIIALNIFGCLAEASLFGFYFGRGFLNGGDGAVLLTTVVAIVVQLIPIIIGGIVKGIKKSC